MYLLATFFTPQRNIDNIYLILQQEQKCRKSRVTFFAQKTVRANWSTFELVSNADCYVGRVIVLQNYKHVPLCCLLFTQFDPAYYYKKFFD
jgi:hypothetical protein